MRAVTGLLPSLLLLTLVVGCGGGELETGATETASGTASGTATSSTTGTPGPTASDLPPAPRRLTPDADGSHYSMAVGATTALVVRGAGATEPEVTGTSVILVPVVNVTDSGEREWEVRAVEVGTSTITSKEPAFTITLTVG